FALVEAGHESPEKALVLQLAKPARLRARVRDAGAAAISGAAIELSVAPTELAQPHPMPVDAARIVRPAKTEGAGTAPPDDLPPDVELALAVTAAGCAPLQQKGALRLEAGATVEREFRLGTIARVQGRVVTASGDPVEAAHVVMAPRLDP